MQSNGVNNTFNTNHIHSTTHSTHHTYTTQSANFTINTNLINLDDLANNGVTINIEENEENAKEDSDERDSSGNDED